MMQKETFHLLAVIFGVIASVLVVLAIASYLGYVPTAWVDNLTDGELAVFATLAIIAAGASAYEERNL